MSKKAILSFAISLLVINIFCWEEVFLSISDNNLKVHFFDVGQGDSAFIETPGNHQILIDGGPNSSVLEKLSSLIPFWDKTVDLVVLTHPETDHMQGVINFLKTYKADYILWTGVEKDSPDYKVWMNILNRQKGIGSKIIIAESGQQIKAGHVVIETMFPLESIEGQNTKNTSNDTCVVSKVIYGNNSFLFTGDIGFVAEKDLINRGGELSSNILKISHHGSKYSTSEEFLLSVNPEMAIISVGAKNTYGHPTPEVLQRLEKSGIKVLRTDIDGDVEFVSDGNNIKLINN